MKVESRNECHQPVSRLLNASLTNWNLVSLFAKITRRFFNKTMALSYLYSFFHRIQTTSHSSESLNMSVALG